ncbi:MAG: C40 family peptidase [Steroidobacteraceae bacterium]|jgi:cell wall-associated NlpC family hydrolase
MRTALAAAGLTLALAACTTAPARKPVPYAAPGVQTPPAWQSPRTAIVNSATAMLGQPYRYGGAAPGGFDCSGLVVFATASAGLRLPRTAQEQMRAGAPVARAQLQAGDLVFMHLARKELHVGIAVDADRFVHAPAAGRRVRIDSLSAPPYARAYVTARRIVNDDAAAAGPGVSPIQSAPGALSAN